MDSLKDRIRRSVAQRGYVGTLQLSVVSLGWMIFPRFRRTEAERERVDAEFDRKYGVDTGGVFRPKQNDVVGQHWAFGGNYQAVDPSVFVQILGRLHLPFEDFTFVDLGSGKGRTLLLASSFPFRRIVGVEYCRELNKIARTNLARFQPPERRCAAIETHHADAAEFQMPDGPLVLFLFHPFAEPVMSTVVSNLTESFRKNPRRIVVVYCIPNHASVWERTGLFHRIGTSPAVFDTHPACESKGKELLAAAQALYFLVIDACSQICPTLNY